MRLYAGAAGIRPNSIFAETKSRRRFWHLRTPTTATRSRFSRLPWANPDTCHSVRFTKPQTRFEWSETRPDA